MSDGSAGNGLAPGTVPLAADPLPTEQHQHDSLSSLPHALPTEDWPSWANTEPGPQEELPNHHDYPPDHHPRKDSHNPVPSPEQLRQLAEAVHLIRRSHGKMFDAFDQAMTIRDQTSFNRKNRFDQHAFLLDSQQSVTDHLSDALRLSSAHDTDAMHDKRRRMQQDYEALVEHDAKLRESERLLSETEYYIYEKNKDMLHAADAFLNLIAEMGLVTLQDPSNPAEPQLVHRASSLRPPSPQNPPELELYWEKAGAVGWKYERLLELRADYQEALTDINFRQDQDQHLEFSTDDIVADFQQRIHDLELAYQTAQDEAAQARELCLRKDIDPDIYRTLDYPDSPWTSPAPDNTPTPPASIVHVRSTQDLISEQIATPSMLTTHLYHDSTMHTQRGKSGTKSSQSRVKEWMNSTDLVPEYESIWDKDDFDQDPKQRRKLVSQRSTDDFKRIPLISSEIQDRTPQHLQSARDQLRSDSDECILVGRPYVKTKPRRVKSFSGLTTKEYTETFERHPRGFDVVLTAEDRRTSHSTL